LSGDSLSARKYQNKMRFLKTLSFSFLAATLALSSLTSAENFATGDNFAWSEGSGWIELTPDLESSAHIAFLDRGASHLNGYGWSEGSGWIQLWKDGNDDGVVPELEAQSDTEFGVFIDRKTGLLSGYAFSELGGWIEFGNPGGLLLEADRPRIAHGTDGDGNGELSGFAWSETLGWLALSSVDLDWEGSTEIAFGGEVANYRVFGDFTGEAGKIDSTDIVAFAGFLDAGGIGPFPFEGLEEEADVDGDGEVGELEDLAALFTRAVTAS
jgi:hypothetical protein